MLVTAFAAHSPQTRAVSRAEPSPTDPRAGASTGSQDKAREAGSSRLSPSGGTAEPSHFLPAAGTTTPPALGAAAAAPSPLRRAELVPPAPGLRALHGQLPPPAVSLLQLLTALPWLRPSTSLNPPPRSLPSPPGRREHSDTLRLPPLPGSPQPPSPKSAAERRKEGGEGASCPYPLPDHRSRLPAPPQSREAGGEGPAGCRRRRPPPIPPPPSFYPFTPPIPSPQCRGPAAPPPRQAQRGVGGAGPERACVCVWGGRPSLPPYLPPLSLREDPRSFPSLPALTPGRRRSCCRPDRRKDRNPPSPPQPPPRASVTGPRPQDPAPLIYGGAPAGAARRGACLQLPPLPPLLAPPAGLPAPLPVGKSPSQAGAERGPRRLCAVRGGPGDGAGRDGGPGAWGRSPAEPGGKEGAA